MKFFTAAAAFLASATLVAGQPNIVEIASADADFETLVVAVAAAGLVDDLSSAGPFSKYFCYSRVCVSSF
jgi:uncharacterized surface protein with fasciclin (FAS1) repeats